MVKEKEVAIRVEGVYKDFSYSSARSNTLKSVFTGMFKSQDKEAKVQHALKEISFEIKKGEFFGIVGRNGSGKSTLLKIIAGIYQPSKGSVAVSGKLVPFIELGVGFNPELTGKENVYLNGAMLGFSDKEVDKFYDEVVEFAELEKFMDKKLKNYSSGMQVRLAFSMAIRAKADILLVDEVLAVGDADFQRKCFRYFRELKKNKQTVVFVSHDMDAIREYCSRAILIDKNKAIYHGNPAIVASKYSRLFMEKKEINEQKIVKKKNSKTGPSGEERWGDGKIILEYVKTSVSDDNKSIIIMARCKAIVGIEEPIFGFSIKNQLLQQLIGTNTVRKNIKIESMVKGAVKKIQWIVPNILNEGEYYVDCTVAHEDAISVGDRWPDACTIQIYREETNPYTVYSPDIYFSEEET